MGFIKRLFGFGDAPLFAIYVDLSSKGNYSARVIRANDAEIGRGKPGSLWVRPVHKRFNTAAPAVMDAIRQLQAMGAADDNVPVYVERAEGGVETKAPVRDWLL